MPYNRYHKLCTYLINKLILMYKIVFFKVYDPFSAGRLSSQKESCENKMMFLSNLTKQISVFLF